MKISSGEKRIYAVANVPAGDSHASLLNDLEEIDDIKGLENNVVISTKIVDRPNDRLVMSGWVKTAYNRALTLKDIVSLIHREQIIFQQSSWYGWTLVLRLIYL